VRLGEGSGPYEQGKGRATERRLDKKFFLQDARRNAPHAGSLIKHRDWSLGIKKNQGDI